MTGDVHHIQCEMMFVDRVITERVTANAPVSADLFKFTVPAGADVIEQ